MLLTASVVFLFAVAARAADTEPKLSIDDVKDNVVFVNKKTDTQGLVVKKEVETASETETAPRNAEFTFTLEINGRFAPEEVYVLFGSDGKEIKRYYEKGKDEYHDMTQEAFESKTRSNWFEVDRKTNEAGEFVLKADQTAVFTELSTADRYKVTETEMPPNFMQVVPAANGAAEGVLVPEGSSALFRNRYFTEPATEHESQIINVTKRIATISGFEADDYDAEFTFNISVAGSPWAEKPYFVYDLTTDKLLRSTDNTDENGNFTLHGNEKAVFESVPKFTKYSVTEADCEGWWPIGETEHSGIIGNLPIFADFTNGRTSFGVHKTMKDSSVVPEEAFTFVLTDKDGLAIAGASYRVFDKSGSCISEESLSTDAFGQFKIKAGETAIFTGMRPGTVYSVKENPGTGYTQVTPASKDGYTSQKVTNTPSVISFVNDIKDITGSLSVSKSVVSETGPIDSGKSFGFAIYDKDGNPLADRVYTLGGNTYRTDENGVFNIKDGQTVTFERLITDRAYRVEELGVLLEDGTYSLEDYKPLEGESQSDTLTSDGLSFKFTNYYKSTFDFTILKVNNKDNTVLLAGAKFLLEKLDENNNIDKSFAAQEVVTGEDGTAVFRDVVSGRYKLTELIAPEKHEKLRHPIIIELSLTNKTITRSDVSGDGAVTSLEDSLVIENSMGIRLPDSGGSGTTLMTALAVVMMASSTIILIARRKRRYA